MTPPLNSYYRRLVQQIANRFQNELEHESIGGDWWRIKIRKATSKNQAEVKVVKGEDWDTVYREKLDETEKAVLIVVKNVGGVDIHDPKLRTMALEEAAMKSPTYRLKQFDYK